MAYVGEIRMFGGTSAPSGWSLCDGSVLNIEDYPLLFEYLGNTYGGDGSTTFGLPDLGTNVPIHRSNVYAVAQSDTAPLGVDAQPAPVSFMIALDIPQTDGELPFIGEIRTFSFGAIPRGWSLCDGSIVNVSDNETLFAVIENRYGGDPQQQTFALPDLRANTVEPVEATDPLGYVVMSDCIATEGIYPASS